MECTRSVTIKEEPDIDYCDNGENGIDFLKTEFDAMVKIENSMQLEDDWYLENKDLLLEIDKRLADIDYECNICNQKFTDSHLLFQHNLDHLAVNLYKETIHICDICSAVYLTRKEIIHHIRVKHHKRNNLKEDLVERITKSRVQCKKCKKYLKHKSLYCHMKTVHSRRKEKCLQCGEIFKCKRYLKRHIMYIHDGVIPKWRKWEVSKDEVCACDECGKKFENWVAIKTHKKNCHSVRSYQCFICKSVLKCRTYLLTHIQRVHYFDGKTHTCSVCSKTYKSPRYVRIHERNCHGEEKNRLSIES